jgi:hypothetical protein
MMPSPSPLVGSGQEAVEDLLTADLALVAASSPWPSSVGRNSMAVVRKNVQDAQLDSAWQSISTGRAQ